jgi:allophycocyanin-B
MSMITSTIAIADREARYLTIGELHNLRDFFTAGQQRLRIAKILAANTPMIINQGTQRFWQSRPITPSNSGNPTYRASCLRDQSWYMRLVTYALVEGDSKIIDTVGIQGAQAMYISLGIPLANLVECMRCLKESALALLSLEDAAMAAPYFDYIISGLKP